jgi:AcrR family transcriptional regulator
MRDRLLDAALLCAAAKGPAQVTVDDVIQTADVARGTFYKYFDTPDALIRELGQAVSDALIAAMHPMVLALNDPAAGIAAGVRVSVGLVAPYPLIGAFLVRAGWPSGIGTERLFVAQVSRNLGLGIASGRFRQMYPEVATSLVAGTTLGAMQAVLAGRRDPDFPAQVAASVLRGLGLPDAEAQRLATLPLLPPTFGPETILARLTIAKSAGVP